LLSKTYPYLKRCCIAVTDKNKFYGSDDKRRSVATIDSKIYAALKVGFLFKFGEQTVKFKSPSNLSPKTLNSAGQI